MTTSANAEAALEEWTTVLNAFKTQDPNGNGEPDEVPLSPRSLWQLEWFGSSGLDLDIYYSFAAAAGLFNSVINLTLILLVNRMSKQLTGTSLW